MTPTAILIATLLVIAAGFIVFWGRQIATGRDGSASPGALHLGIGFVTNFLDTLGIGSFATTTTIYRLKRLVDDRKIPGTLNVGHALPTVAQAWIYTTLVEVEFTTLALLILAAIGGSWIGAAIVTGMPQARDPARHGRGAAGRRGADDHDGAQPLPRRR